jgi:pimeloyl-ACP methyl ester carboxylesterase
MLSIWLLVAIAPAQAASRTGPAGRGFYYPPKQLIAGPHGSVVWAHDLHGIAAPAGGRSTRVLYRSVSVAGRPIVVSGMVTVPRGTPPRGGWPLISYAHGTSGTADRCAPSRGPRDWGGLWVQNWLLHRYVLAGYAIAQTDYEGLGTAGVHPYLVGRSEGRSVIDMALAARAVDPAIGRRWVSMGHSQGGHAALWAASLGPAWAPRLRLVGAVALAPATQVETIAEAIESLKEPNGGLSSFGALALKAYESLTGRSVLSDAARPLWPSLGRQCITQLYRTWARFAPADLFKPGADLAAINRYGRRQDPALIGYRVPVFLAQGKADRTVPSVFNETTAKQWKARGVRVAFHEYPGADHDGAATSSYIDASRWVRARFRPTYG